MRIRNIIIPLEVVSTIETISNMTWLGDERWWKGDKESSSRDVPSASRGSVFGEEVATIKFFTEHL
jgi:hypothetical protein